jgi:hypothetical protein
LYHATAVRLASPGGVGYCIALDSSFSKETDVASTSTSPLSPVLYYCHLGLTAVLLVGVFVVVGLAAIGWVHFGRPGGHAAALKETDRSPESDGDGAKEKTPDTDGKSSSTEKAGRYQIEVMDDIRHVMGEAGKLGVLGDRVREAWVFRYKGGFLECKLETDFGGKSLSSGVIPEDWSRFLSQDEGISKGRPKSLRKEGYIVLLGMTSMLSVDQALQPFHPHLGAMFTVGPAGPLHALIPYFHEVWRRREYRLFLSAGPPKGETGQGFNLWAGDLVLIRTHLVGDDPYQDPAHTTGGKDLQPGKEIAVLERSRGLSKIRLKARFLTDEEAIKKAK